MTINTVQIILCVIYLYVYTHIVKCEVALSLGANKGGTLLHTLSVQVEV